MAEQATKSIIVGAGVGEVFEAWSNFENFPSFMKNIKSVEKRADGSTHWTMDGPLGKSVEWDAETTMFEPQKRIAWRSREGSTIKTSGQVTFAEMGTGQTQVNLTIQWVVPASKGGEKPSRGSSPIRRSGWRRTSTASRPTSRVARPRSDAPVSPAPRLTNA